MRFTVKRISVCRRSVPIYRRGGEVITVFDAGVSSVSLNAVHDAVLDTLHDAHMVGQAVALPVVEDCSAIMSEQGGVFVWQDIPVS